MSRIVKCAHIQASNAKHDGSPAEIKEAMIQKHIPLIEEAGEKGVNILCLQELFYGPYFCAEQDNRIGLEKPWELGTFYGSSYFVDPRGKLLVKGSEDKDEVVVADLDLEQIREVRDGWQFFRDLRPDQYVGLTETVDKYR